MRFRCVSRSWYFLIEEPHFVSAQLNFNVSASRARSYLVCDWPIQTFTISCYDENFQKIKSYERPAEPGRLRNWDPFSTAPCYGIVCLSDMYLGRVYLWNPSIQKMRMLPESNLHYPIPRFVIGIGFTRQNMECKVVRIFSTINVVEVYSLSSGSWKTITSRAPYLPNLFPECTYFNGALHWITITDEASYVIPNSILSFDLDTEVFKEIMLPKLDIVNGQRSRSIGVFKDRLSCSVDPPNILERTIPPDHTNIEIWSMEEYGVHQSWVKLFKIRLFIPAAVYFGWDKFLLLRVNMYNSSHLLLYDTSTGLFRYLGDKTVGTPITYVESLLLI